MTAISPLGKLVTKRRMEVGLSVRALARKIGCSHVHLGDLERGERPVIGSQFWPSLAAELGVSEQNIEEAAKRSESLQFDPWLMPPAGETFLQQFARQVEGQNITNEQFQRMLEVLKNKEKQE